MAAYSALSAPSPTSPTISVSEPVPGVGGAGIPEIVSGLSQSTCATLQKIPQEVR